MASVGLDLHEIASTIRFIQGYRFLDRCGDAIVKLEGSLDEAWVPGETSPKGGVLVNHELGMVAQFHSESVTVKQSEFFDFDYFRDQACKIFDVLRQSFEIKRVNAPTLKVVWQRGFEDVEKAEKYLRSLSLTQPNNETVAMLNGRESSFSFTVCTEADISWQDMSVLQRRRLDVKTVMQERQPTFDERLLRRARLLPKRQSEAMQALANLRRRHPKISSTAAQIDVENAFETEFDADTFDLPTFFDDSWEWHQNVCHCITQTKRGEPK